MVDWLIDQQLTISILLLLLIVAERKLIPFVGAKFCYALFAAIPLALIIGNIPEAVKPQLNTEISQYIVALSNGSTMIESSVSWLAIWLLGCGVVIMLCLYSHYQLSLANSLQAVNNLQAQIQLPSALKIYQSDKVASPLLVGLVGQKLILPQNFQQLYSARQLAMIIEHEVCHFQRKDTLCNLIALLLISLFWFNPLIWLGYKSFRRLQEVSCDENVLANKNTKDKIQYGKAMLLSIENSNNQLYTHTHYTEKQTMLKRLNFIKQQQHNKPLVKVAAVALIASLLGGMAVAHEPSSSKAEHVAPITRVEPVYPSAAVEQNLNGSVVLQFDISSAGKVEHVIVINAEPKKVFDNAAKIALRQWQYQSSTHGVKNQLVQLDFVAKGTEKPADLIERIKVTK
ncbi:M56 family metallopeptidase [Thalassotalea sp. ND16A]|uniref:M56 family metallopeptidase n=1 Tax=Thalassotalea sp. ND16A TaxID=1535422 RepID=UPI00051A751A|nr:M56 family metallopeptidase [Thalassotalea sp. ND16A]KGJ98506.1 hypothetical protein ND16A_0576 [Thalassotalea sp. ND16A]